MQKQGSLSLRGRMGREVWTVPDLLQARSEGTPDSSSQSAYDELENTWQAVSWSLYYEEAQLVAGGLTHLGLMPGGRVGILAQSSTRWDRVQMGVLAAGGVVVGLDPHDLDENLEDIARRCGLVGIVVQDPAWLHRFSVTTRDAWLFTVCTSPATEDQAGSTLAYAELLRLGKEHPPRPSSAVGPDSPATIIFTSGTTGTPKGIQYTHRQLCQAVASIMSAFPDIDQNSRLICWLPLSNMFQRIINLLAIATGASTYYVENPRSIMQHLVTVSPQLFIGVPRFYEKLYAGISGHIAKQPPLRRALVNTALWIGDRHARAQREGVRPGIFLRKAFEFADRGILSRVRAVMGKELAFMVSGSAPMPPWLLERFHAMGLLVLEAYGMSENVIPIAANRRDAFRFGTVGRAMDGCEIRIAEDGELLVRGEGVLRHYLGEESTLLDAEGYLPSGDYARVDEDGFITLLGRKSEIIKTATGRRIAPAQIESFLLHVQGIENAAVFGATRPFLVALVTLSGNGHRSGSEGADKDTDLIAVVDELQQEVRQVLASLPEYKRPAGLLITRRPFSVEGGELTASLKMRRRVVSDRYEAEIDKLYEVLQQKESGQARQIMHRESEEILLCSL